MQHPSIPHPFWQKKSKKISVFSVNSIRCGGYSWSGLVPLRMWNSELKKHPGWPTMPRCNQVQGVSFNWCPPKIHMYGKVSATKVNSDTFWWNFLTQLFLGHQLKLEGEKMRGGRAPVNTVYITIRSNMTKWLLRILKISNAIFAWEMNPPLSSFYRNLTRYLDNLSLSRYSSFSVRLQAFVRHLSQYQKFELK